MVTIIPINNKIKEDALYWTFMRNRTKRVEGVEDQRIDVKRGTLLIDYMGMIAEIAVSKVLNCPFLQNEQNLYGDEGFDLLWHGIKIQVKYTFYESGHLLLGKPNSDPKLASDIYVLTVGNENTIKILGYVTKEATEQLMVQKDFGFGLTWCIEQKHLRDIKKLGRI